MGNHISSIDEYDNFSQEKKRNIDCGEGVNPYSTIAYARTSSLLHEAILSTSEDTKQKVGLSEDSRKLWKQYTASKIEPKPETYDFIIIGAGTAGCVLAKELIYHLNVNILVLEAGPPDAQANTEIHAPFDVNKLWTSLGCDWGYQTEPQTMPSSVDPEKKVQNPGFPFPRGKVWGGSSSTNAMIYIRGQKEEYEKWAAQGPKYNEIWNWDKCREGFINTEKNSRPEPSIDFDRDHGSSGLLSVEDSYNGIYGVMQAVIDAAKGKGLNIPENWDFNGPNQNGVGKYQVTMENGRRCSFARGFLNMALKKKSRLYIGKDDKGYPQQRLSGVNVKSNSTALNIIWANDETNTAIGVSYYYDGIEHEVYLNQGGEVLLCGGAINSPCLLMQSGVGPKDDLRKQNIYVHADLPVGKNLMDHPLCPVTASFKKEGQGSQLTETHIWSNGAEVAIFHKAREDGKLPSNEDFQNTSPDMQHSCAASVFDSSLLPFTGDGFTIAPVINIPKSVGWLEFDRDSKTSNLKPKIFVNYYREPSDLYRMISAIRLARNVIKNMPQDWNAKEVGFDEWGGAEMTDEEYEKYIRAKTYTSFHPCGTVKMAPRENGGVVDQRLRVYGTRALRVIDASIFPIIPSGNLNAPTGMVAWRASRLIIEDTEARTSDQL